MWVARTGGGGLMVRKRASHVRSGGEWGFMSGHMRGSQWLWVFT